MFEQDARCKSNLHAIKQKKQMLTALKRKLRLECKVTAQSEGSYLLVYNDHIFQFLSAMLIS